MGKIFGISDLPVSTIGNAIRPVQDMFIKGHTKCSHFVTSSASQKQQPVKDVFVKSTRPNKTARK